MNSLTIFICIFAISLGILYYMVNYKHCTKEKFEYALPNKETSIGGQKGPCPMCHNGIGYYPEDYSHFTLGSPNGLYGKKTIIDPSQIGFSSNSLINRNQYSDFYDSIGNRRLNPNFKFITKFRGLELHPMVYSEPEYSSSVI